MLCEAVISVALRCKAEHSGVEHSAEKPSEDLPSGQEVKQKPARFPKQ